MAYVLNVGGSRPGVWIVSQEGWPFEVATGEELIGCHALSEAIRRVVFGGYPAQADLFALTNFVYSIRFVGGQGLGTFHPCERDSAVIVEQNLPNSAVSEGFLDHRRTSGCQTYRL